MKRNYSHINSLAELVAERHRLKISYEQQGEVLKDNAVTYVRQFTPLNMIKSFFNLDNFSKLDSKVNISGKIMSLVLPFLLNKTLFRGSGFLTKTAVGLISNKLGGKLDLEHLSGIADTVKGWFTKRKEKREVDYGIPPDSETY